MKKNKLFLIAQVFLIATSAMAGEPTRFELGSSNSWNCSNYSSTNKTIYSGSTIELNGVTVTIGNSEQKEQSWIYDAKGYLPNNSPGNSGYGVANYYNGSSYTGVSSFNTESPYSNLPNRGAYLKIVPTESGQITIKITRSDKIKSAFVTTSNGTEITAAQLDNKAETNTYEVSAGNTYYFFPLANNSDYSRFRWYLKGISFVQGSSVSLAKAKLKMLLDQANGYYNNSIDFDNARATLNSFISDANTVYENTSATLDNVNQQVDGLSSAIQTFVTSGAKPTNGTYFDLTFKISHSECNVNDNWSGSGRVFGKGKHWSGDTNREYFEKNGNGDRGNNRTQTVTVPVAGNYLLKTSIYNVSDNASGQVEIVDVSTLRSYNYYGTTGGTIATDGSEWVDVATGLEAGKSFANGNKGYGWFYNKIYFTTSGANERKQIKLYQTGNGSNGFESAIGGMFLYYYGDQDVNNVTLNETQTVPVGAAGVDVTYSRSLVKGFNSIVLPFAVDNIESAFGTGAKAYGLSSVSTNGTGYTLNFTEAKTMAANTPYLLELNEAKTSTTFSSVTMEPTVTATKMVDNVSFIGTYVQTTANAGDYLVNAKSQTLAKANGSNTIKAYRAKITLPENAGAAKARFTIDGETTAIEGINAADFISPSNNQLFDLNGRQVNNPNRRGIYIFNGKKIIIK